MSKILQCPWFASDGFSKWCMNGHFPCNCETCNCEDKNYVEINTTTSTTCINENKDMKANEAPEKLYFGESDKGILDIYSDRESDDEVEYTRTDAFMKKADEFIGSFFHPDDTELRNCLLKKFHEYMMVIKT